MSYLSEIERLAALKKIWSAIDNYRDHYDPCLINPTADIMAATMKKELAKISHSFKVEEDDVVQDIVNLNLMMESEETKILKEDLRKNFEVNLRQP